MVKSSIFVAGAGAGVAVAICNEQPKSIDTDRNTKIWEKQRYNLD